MFFLLIFLLQLTGIAKHIDGTLAEDSIPMMVTVLDQNDNAPTFELHTGNITEASKKGNTKLYSLSAS